MYNVTVKHGLNESDLLKEETNDLALLSSVLGPVSGCLMLPPSRIELIHKSRVVTKSQLNQSLFKFSSFERNLTFQAIVIPPKWCGVCSHAHYWKNTFRLQVFS